MPPQKEVRQYPQIRLTEMNKHRHYSDGVGDEVYQLQLVLEEKTSEEIPDGDVEPTLEEGTEDDLLLDVFRRERLARWRLPLHLRLWS
jgi:hypothetical protein